MDPLQEMHAHNQDVLDGDDPTAFVPLELEEDLDEQLEVVPVTHSVELAANTGGLKLSEDSEGLIWQPICKTGELALSPGPGQVDLDRPLKITERMLGQVVDAFHDRAFEYVTIPDAHLRSEENPLRNKGFVRELDLRDSTAQNDPPGTKVLWAAQELTDPQAKAAVLNGSVAARSVGIKFNYRRKRDGKTYPAALEHVMLTNYPWIDGLNSELLAASQEPGEQFDGLYVFHDSPEDTGDILAGDQDPVKLLSRELGQMEIDTDTHIDTDEDTITVEALLAQERAAREDLESRFETQQTELMMAQNRLQDQAEKLHAEDVAKKIRKWQTEGVAPAVLSRVQSVMLADVPTEDSSMHLSVPVQIGDEQSEVALESASDIVELILSALPRDSSAARSAHLQAVSLEELQASQHPNVQKTAKDMADEIEQEVGKSEAA